MPLSRRPKAVFASKSTPKIAISLRQLMKVIKAGWLAKEKGKNYLILCHSPSIYTMSRVSTMVWFLGKRALRRRFHCVPIKVVTSLFPGQKCISWLRRKLQQLTERYDVSWAFYGNISKRPLFTMNSQTNP